MFKNTRRSTMLSLAATVAWPFTEVNTSQQHLFGTAKDVQNGSSILHYKSGAELELFFLLENKNQQEKKQTNKQTRCSVHRHQSGERRLPQQGVRQAVVAAAQSYCSMLLIVLLVDSSFRCLVVYLQGRRSSRIIAFSKGNE